jgi:tetratricopeptide (TPR) repeat protein
MTLVLPKELTQAKELMDQGKLDEALEIINQFEKIESLSPEDMLSALLVKGKVYLYKQQTRKALYTFEVAFQISEDIGLESESVAALIGKAHIGFIGERDEGLTYVSDAEKRLESLVTDPFTRLFKRDLLLVKSWILYFQSKAEAFELAERCLRLTEEEHLGNELDLANIYLLLGGVNRRQNPTRSLDFTMKSLELNKEFNHTVAIADNYSMLAKIFQHMGHYNLAKQYSKQALSIKHISEASRYLALDALFGINFYMSKYNRAIKYLQECIALTEKFHFVEPLINSLNHLGRCYRVIGKYDLGVESLKRALVLSEKQVTDVSQPDVRMVDHIVASLHILTEIYIEIGSRENANRYFSRLSEFRDQVEDTEFSSITFSYLNSKAYIMKTSNRIRDRMEAQRLYKKLIDLDLKNKFWPLDILPCLSNFCDLLLEELSMSNDPEILDEIIPLIARGLERVEKMHSYHWLAEIKLLQAKLALIQMNIEEAKKLMVESQRIAELYGLTILASRISSEHDKLLEQIELWDKIDKDEAPLGDRVKLASTKDVLERLQGRRALESPEPVDEQSLLLLILAEGGVLIFSYPFSEEWKFDDELFGGFLTAFSSISDEIFAVGLDRAKFGDQTVLVEQVANFSICYLFKGQTYIAQKKLAKFVEEAQHNSSLWQNLEQHYKTSQILELKDNPALETLITEIFVSKK